MHRNLRPHLALPFIYALTIRASLGWIAVFVCCAVEAQAEEMRSDGPDEPDEQLAQAKKELAEAEKLEVAGKYANALLLAEHALQRRETALGAKDPGVAECLYWLGRIYWRQGNFFQSERFYQHALQIREVSLGGNHPDVAKSLISLALLYQDQGAYERAEPLYQRALQILESILGKNHPSVASVLLCISILYSIQGEYSRAETLGQRALQIQEMVLGKTHPETISALINVAIFYKDQKKYRQAEDLLQRALQVEETAEEKNYLRLSRVLANLAIVYGIQGYYLRAEALLRRSLQLKEVVLGRSHPDVALTLGNLANLYFEEGAYQHAESLLQQALQIFDTARMKGHPAAAQALNALAKIYLASKRVPAAWPLFELSFSISENRLRKEALILSDARLTSFLSLLQNQDDAIYSLLREGYSESAILHLALSIALLHKGRSVSEIGDISRAIYRDLNQTDREIFQRLRALRTQLAILSLSVPRQPTHPDDSAHFRDLESRGDELEADLAKRSSILRVQRQLPSLTNVIPRVMAALPADGALIEIVAFSAYPVAPRLRIPSKVPSTPAYLALILLPNGDIRVADLGPAAAIDSAIAHLRDTLAQHYVDYLPASQELYRLVFKPIAPLLGSQRQLFISPDGQLNLVPFAALHDGTRFLTDAYDIIYLTSGKDLLARATDIEPARSVVVFADPTSDNASASVATPLHSTPSPSPPDPARRSNALERFFTRQVVDWMNIPLKPLPGARQEAQAIRRFLPQAQLYVGPAATKKAFLELITPGILHIGTHADYLGAPTPPVNGTTNRTQMESSGTAGPRYIPPEPLLRSFLFLAGAPTPASGSADDLRARQENSLVTALEIAGMNLWGTQLVVLSACDTGQGDVQIGQGVYGLRRAFTVAGAETLVTSLWNVDDGTTQKLMEGYYQRLIQGQGRAHAMREAMAGVRAEHPHPYYWAPFIVVGNGAPLRGFGSPAQAPPPVTH